LRAIDNTNTKKFVIKAIRSSSQGGGNAWLVMNSYRTVETCVIGTKNSLDGE